MTRQKLLVGSDLDDLASVHSDDARARVIEMRLSTGVTQPKRMPTGANLPRYFVP
jgi:hypothetical protein